MSVTNQANKVNYTASGLTSYVIPFFFTENSDIKFYVNDILKVLDTDYSVTGAGVDGGGTLTIIGTPPASGIVTVLRDIPIKQENSLNEGGPAPAKVQERMFDKLTYIAQQIKELAERAVKLPLSSNANAQIVGVFTPNAFLKANSAGTGLEMGPDATVYEAQLVGYVSDSSASAAAAAASEASVAANASSALASANSATASASSATSSASAASTSASSASSSQSAASASASTASTAATTATTQATNAGNSASAASTSANSASTSATTATTQAGNASTSASAASTSASNASGSASAASTSASNAAASAAAIATVVIDSTSGSETTKAPSVASIKTYVLANAGGGGGSLSWEKLGNLSPENESQDGIKLESFGHQDEQEIYLTINVPSNYIAGNPIVLKNGAFFINATTGNILFRTVSTLLRAASTVLGNYVNNYTSTNTQLTAPGALNQLKAIGDLDLTNGTGQINGVAVAANDKIRVKLSRVISSETSSATDKAKLMINNFDVTFK